MFGRGMAVLRRRITTTKHYTLEIEGDGAVVGLLVVGNLCVRATASPRIQACVFGYIEDNIALSVEGASARPTISNCQFKGGEYGAIFLRGAGGWIDGSNVFSDCSVGILVTSAESPTDAAAGPASPRSAASASAGGTATSPGPIGNGGRSSCSGRGRNDLENGEPRLRVSKGACFNNCKSALKLTDPDATDGATVIWDLEAPL